MKTKVKFILTVLSVGLLLSMSISIGLLFRKSPRVFAADKEKAKIAFIIDDCYADNETYGTEDIIETFDTYGFKLGLAVITKWSADGNGISPTVMRHAYGNGHEILSHSVLHEQRWNDKSTYSSTEALREARNSHKYLTDYGLEVSGFVTPYTMTNKNLLTELINDGTYSEFYGTCSDSTRDNIDIIPRKWLNKGNNQGKYATASVAYMLAEIDELIASGGKKIYFTHQKSEWSIPDFISVLDYLRQKSNDIEVVTPKKLVSSVDNSHRIGNKSSHIISGTEKTGTSSLNFAIPSVPSSVVYPDLLIRYTYHSGSGDKYPTIALSDDNGNSRNLMSRRFVADNKTHNIRINVSDIDFGQFSKLTFSAWTSFTIHGISLEWVTLSSLKPKKTAEQIVSDFGAGWNLGNSLEVSQVNGSETAWGNRETTQEIMNYVAQKGFKSVRINASWEYHSDSSNVIDAAYTERVKTVVDYALNAGMNAILDYHHPYYEKYTDQTSTDTSLPAKARGLATISNYWSQIATAFKHYDQRLSFEILNEPRDRAHYYSDVDIWSGCYESVSILNEYNAKAVEVIRNTGFENADRLLLLPTYANSTGEIACRYFVLPENAGNVAIAVHAYAPHKFAFTGDLGHTEFTETEYTALENIISAAYNRLSRFNVPIVITETGATNKLNQQARAQWAFAYTSIASRYNIPCFLWDNGIKDTSNNAYNPYYEAFGMLNRSKNSNILEWYYPEIVEAFISGAENPDSEYENYESTEIFANGKFSGTFAGGTSNEVLSVDGAVVWQATGNYNGNRLIFNQSINFAELDNPCISLTYFSSNCLYPEIRLLNKLGNYGDFAYIKYGLTVISDGAPHNIIIPVSLFSEMNATSLWGATVSQSFDKTSVKGIAFSFGGILNISEIKVIYTQAETPLNPDPTPEPEQPEPIQPETAPAAPTNVRCTIITNGISVCWNASESATVYYVYRSISWGSAYSLIGTVETNSFSDNTCARGTRYYYKIVAANSAGESSASDPKGITYN